MSVHAKLLEAQRSVEAVVKQGKNTQQNYTYVQAADVIAVCRKALHDAGLLAAVEGFVVTDRHDFVSAKGAKGLHVEGKATLKVVDPEDGMWMTFNASGAGADYGGGDKAILKASTAATKYVYAGALALPFADFDPEKDVAGDPGRVPEQKADPETALSDEKVDELVALLKASKVGFQRLCVVIGSIGAEAPKIKRADSIRKSLATLTEPQAEQLANLLDAEKGEGE